MQSVRAAIDEVDILIAHYESRIAKLRVGRTMLEEIFALREEEDEHKHVVGKIVVGKIAGPIPVSGVRISTPPFGALPAMQLETPSSSDVEEPDETSQETHHADLTRSQERVFNYLKQHPMSSVLNIASGLNTTVEHVKSSLKFLRASDRVVLRRPNGKDIAYAAMAAPGIQHAGPVIIKGRYDDAPPEIVTPEPAVDPVAQRAKIAFFLLTRVFKVEPLSESEIVVLCAVLNTTSFNDLKIVLDNLVAEGALRHFTKGGESHYVKRGEAERLQDLCEKIMRLVLTDTKREYNMKQILTSLGNTADVDLPTLDKALSQLARESKLRVRTIGTERHYVRT